MKPINFALVESLALPPEEIAQQILDVAKWPDFHGYGPIPGIRTAEFVVQTPNVVGSRFRVTNLDGSTHVEEIVEWRPDRRLQLRMGEFSAPLSHLATGFVETWDFKREDDKTKVTRSFEMHAKSMLTKPVLWSISFFVRRAIARHLQEMKAGKCLMQHGLFRTEAEIVEGLDEVRQAPIDDGVVEAIVIRPGSEERRSLERCRLSADGGTEGDAWARGCWLKLPDGRPHPDVQICIMNSRMIKLLAGEKQRWELAGDNLFIDLNLSRENLSTGQRLRIGDCVLEITEQSHNGCAKFSRRFGPSALKFVNSETGKQLRLRGIYAKVIEAGDVRVGDRITKQ